MKNIVAAVALIAALTGCGPTATTPKTTTAPAAPAQTTTAQAAPAPTTTAGQDVSSKLAQSFKTNFGSTSWGMTVTDIKVKNGSAYIRAQISRNDMYTATHIQGGVVNLVRFNKDDYPGINWVIVEDGTGTVITQQKV